MLGFCTGSFKYTCCSVAVLSFHVCSGAVCQVVWDMFHLALQRFDFRILRVFFKAFLAGVTLKATYFFFLDKTYAVQCYLLSLGKQLAKWAHQICFC